ncbi:hypothetical protein CL653_03100 [bacterium]|nr:hypothetical protein [bacterium]|tara:strand:+ start:1981 stop:2175 length:195 start_codon:yes stop_codon:yes gene_type:complete
MKKVKCDLCEYVAEGETFADWMIALKPHYMEAHKDIMSDPSKTKEDMQKWMSENEVRFNEAPTS